MKPQTPERVLFLDLEASGLGEGSFPIEVGWAWLDGDSGSLLIRPSSEWDLEQWQDEAKALHGISLSDLQRAGSHPRDVADHLNAMVLLEGDPVVVVSDAPDYDQLWLDKLFLETPAPQAFRLVDDEHLRRARFGATPDPGAAEMAAAEPVHRAEPDAVRLRARWLRLIEAQLRPHGRARGDPARPRSSQPWACTSVPQEVGRLGSA